MMSSRFLAVARAPDKKTAIAALLPLGRVAIPTSLVAEQRPRYEPLVPVLCAKVEPLGKPLNSLFLPVLQLSKTVRK